MRPFLAFILLPALAYSIPNVNQEDTSALGDTLLANGVKHCESNVVIEGAGCSDITYFEQIRYINYYIYNLLDLLILI